jgi:hypothetical protein
MKTLLLALVCAFSAAHASAGEIVFPNQPRWNAGQYLAYFYRSIPLAQFHVLPVGDGVALSGPLTLNLSQLPPALKPQLQDLLEQVLRGELKISGATFESNQAEITFRLEAAPPAAKVDVVEQDDRVVIRKSTPEEIRQLQPQMFGEEPQWGGPLGCQQRLLGHVDP